MTIERPHLYAILGVPRGASQAEISHAYRTLLRRHHPDTRTPHDQSQAAASDTTLQQILAAYTVLHDPARRADYDRATTPQVDQSNRRPQQVSSRDASQPPIIAGPVTWHPTRRPSST